MNRVTAFVIPCEYNAWAGDEPCHLTIRNLATEPSTNTGSVTRFPSARLGSQCSAMAGDSGVILGGDVFGLGR